MSTTTASHPAAPPAAQSAQHALGRRRLRARGSTGLALVALGAVGVLLTGCTLLPGQESGSATSVFDLVPGDCALTPEDVTAEVSELRTLECAEPHQLEVFAKVTFDQGDDAEAAYPGDAAAKAFADGACAEHFATYVGVDYRDSDLFFTYLVPSARSWSEGPDRTVTCLITTTGELFTESVAGRGA